MRDCSTRSCVTSTLASSLPTLRSLRVNCHLEPLFCIPHWLILDSIGGFECTLFGVGLCSEQSRARPSRRANVITEHGDHLSDRYSASHSCTQDHIEYWPAQTTVFGDVNRTVRTSVVPYKCSSQTTLVIHIELLGRVYEKMLREANVSFPQLPKSTPRPLPAP